MIFEGNFTVHASPQEVWDFLIDIPRMSVCLAGMQKVEQTGENNYTGVVEVKVGPTAFLFRGSVEKTLEEPPARLVAKVQGLDSATASEVTGEFSSELVRVGRDQTEVKIHLDISIVGFLEQIDQATLEPIFSQTVADFFACVRRRIERPASLAEGSAAPTGRLAAAWRELWSRIKARIQSL